jgi:hypothetical protein
MNTHVSIMARFPEEVYAKKGFGPIQVIGRGSTTQIATVRAIREMFKHPQMRHMRPNWIEIEIAVGGMAHTPYLPALRK